MKNSFLLRVACALLLSTTLLSSCEQLNIAPKGGKGDCKTKTPADSTATGGAS